MPLMVALTVEYDIEWNIKIKSSVEAYNGISFGVKCRLYLRTDGPPSSDREKGGRRVEVMYAN